MKHLVPFNEAKQMLFRHKKRERDTNLRKIEDLDNEIRDIFVNITDSGEYNLEVHHQNGYASYTLFPVNEFYTLVDDFKRDNNLLEDYNSDRILSNIERFSSHMLFISKEIKEIHSRIMDIPGLVGFDITPTGTISIKFDNIPQGYGNLGTVMLVGDPSDTRYAG